MKIVLDMNLSPRLVQKLRTDHHDAIHWSDVGDARADDRQIMAWAAENDFTVLTHDLDFGALLASSTHTKPSVIQIRTRDLLSEQYYATLIDALDRFEEALDNGALVVVEPGRARARILPLD
jgi:predicted nuclease of predicted toxin-antitoxin system